jgi:FkbM family methyltransferase
VKSLIQSIFRRFGLDLRIIRGVYNEHAQLVTLLNYHKCNLVFDIGANTGKFGSQLYSLGWNGRLVSFEPLALAYSQLVANSKRWPLWTVHQRCAIGDIATKVNINIAGNSESSSILNMQQRHRDLAPDSSYIATEEVSVVPLDSCLAQYAKPNDRLFLKIDTQGFEWQVLDGAASALALCKGLQIELSTESLYQDQRLDRDLFNRLYDLGFQLHALWPVVIDRNNGRLVQYDATFFRI